MTAPDALTDVLKRQGAGCAATGSPFSGALLDRAAAALIDQPWLRAAFAPRWDLSRRELFAEAVALRWLGALHIWRSKTRAMRSPPPIQASGGRAMRPGVAAHPGSHGDAGGARRRVHGP